MTRDDAWTALSAAARLDAGVRIVDQFAADPERVGRLTVEAAGLTVDLTRQTWSRAGLEAALALADACDVAGARAGLFAGEAVNVTEGRAVLHPALRAPDRETADGAGFRALGEPVSDAVETTREAMRDYAEAVRAGAQTGATGRPFRAVVHIGIGGSDLGPRLLWDALRPLSPDIDLRFVANIDPRELAEALTGLSPETTLVVVVSKTFTTQETLANAEAARDWLAAGVGGTPPDQGLARHLVGVTAAPERAEAFGCGRTFAFRDWVGGRYSLWSPVGLSCAIALGWPAFQGLLDGAAAMDRHFLDAPAARNAPVLLALAQVFNVDGLDRQARTVAPYAHGLRRLPAYLQQLEMESNGKGVRRDGAPVAHGTCPVVFGEPGTNGQHAFFQQIHQGPRPVPAEFVIVRGAGEAGSDAPLWANAVAQMQALMLGKTAEAAEAGMRAAGLGAAEAARLAPHRAFPGNRPSTAIVMNRLTPEALGALIALYEHKTFVEGVVWDVNSFDQWGVELGKALARTVLDDVAAGAPSPAQDPATAATLRRLLG